MTSMNLHTHDSTGRPLNQMSDGPGDGNGNSDRTGRDGSAKAAGKPPAPDGRDRSTIEAFDEEGAGIAAKE